MYQSKGVLQALTLQGCVTHLWDVLPWVRQVWCIPPCINVSFFIIFLTRCCLLYNTQLPWVSCYCAPRCYFMRRSFVCSVSTSSLHGLGTDGRAGTGRQMDGVPGVSSIPLVLPSARTLMATWEDKHPWHVKNRGTRNYKGKTCEAKLYALVRDRITWP